MTDIESIVDRHARRPGYALATYREVALPYWSLPLRCRILQRKSVPAIEEFVLRALEAGLRTDAQVSSFLGLPSRVVEATMGTLVSAGQLSPMAIEGTGDAIGFTLTTRGRAVVSELTQALPETRDLDVAYDGLARSFTLVDATDRWRPRDLSDAGMLEIPAFPPDPPDIGPRDTPAVSDVLRDVLASTEAELLSVLGLASRREKFFVRAVALVFQPDGHAGDPSVNFVVDGRASSRHDEAFAAAEGRRKLGLLSQLEVEGLAYSQREVSSDLIMRLPSTQEVESLRRVTGALRDRHDRLVRDAESPGSTNEPRVELIESAARLDEAEAALEQLPVRILEVQEHPRYLRDALENAQQRVLIVSPWIRAKVVNRDFLERLERLLESGTEVCIAHGIDDGSNAPEWDKKAERSLTALAGRFENFVLKRLGDTHAKILIVDSSHVIVTSFNWLSYLGDPNQPFRDERGTLVTVPSEIDRLYNDYLSRATS